VNFKQVRLALDEIGYDGFLTPELRGGDQAYLTDLSGRIDKIIAMQGGYQDIELSGSGYQGTRASGNQVIREPGYQGTRSPGAKEPASLIS